MSKMKTVIVNLLKFIPQSLRKKTFGAIRRTLTYDDILMPKVMFEHIGRLKSFGYKPNIVIDIGAYVGAWTEQVLSLFPNAHFLLFEAQQSKIPNLDRLSQKHHNVSYN
jgi:hypothetical protein